MKHLLKFIPENTKFYIALYISRIKAYFNKGEAQYCVCCDKQYNNFLQFGIDRRENAQCPYCFSLERTRLLWLYLKNELKIEKTSLSILHISPEFSLKNKIVALGKHKYISGDYVKGRADIVMDIRNISYPNNYFDLILCSHVLAFIQEEEKALKELKRVLRENSTLIIQTHFDAFNPTKELDPLETGSNFHSQHDMLRVHGNDFLEKLENIGFQVELVDYAKKFSDDEQKRQSFGNGERELMIVCTKKPV